MDVEMWVLLKSIIELIAQAIKYIGIFLLGTILIFLGFALVLYIIDGGIAYLSWKNLTVDEIEQKAKKYSGNTPACLYIVECTTGTPTLRLISNIEQINIDELRNTIWQRRFHQYCKGPTENITLDFPEKFKSLSDARWSFSGNAFITNHGHFQGSAMSFYPFTPCTESNVTWK